MPNIDKEKMEVVKKFIQGLMDKMSANEYMEISEYIIDALDAKQSGANVH